MTAIELEYRDATCRTCSTHVSDFLGRYLKPGETAPPGWCGCETSPVYEPVPCYQAVCDHCGQHVTEYGEWNALTPEWFLWESLPDWRHIWGRDLCPSCWFINDNDQIQEVPAVTEPIQSVEVIPFVAGVYMVKLRHIERDYSGDVVRTARAGVAIVNEKTARQLVAEAGKEWPL